MNQLERYDMVTSTAKFVGLNWPNHEVAKFHRFNPNGLCARVDVVYDRLMKLVEQNKLPSGWLLAHERYNPARETLQTLSMQGKVNEIKLMVALERIEEQAAELKAALEKENL